MAGFSYEDYLQYFRRRTDEQLFDVIRGEHVLFEGEAVKAARQIWSERGLTDRDIEDLQSYYRSRKPGASSAHSSAAERGTGINDPSILDIPEPMPRVVARNVKSWIRISSVLILIIHWVYFSAPWYLLWYSTEVHMNWIGILRMLLPAAMIVPALILTWIYHRVGWMLMIVVLVDSLSRSLSSLALVLNNYLEEDLYAHTDWLLRIGFMFVLPAAVLSALTWFFLTPRVRLIFNISTNNLWWVLAGAVLWSSRILWL